MERINLHFHGKEVNNEDKANIKAQISFHMGNAPSDAMACCCISNEKEGFACNLRVHSAKGHIFIHRESLELEQLLKFVFDSMDQSFKDWHRDPKHFAKSHPLSKNPCKSSSHKNLACPIDAYSHETG